MLPIVIFPLILLFLIYISNCDNYNAYHIKHIKNPISFHSNIISRQLSQTNIKCHGNKQETNAISDSKKLLPVTILSGFLGAGKTTLLRHILTNKQNLNKKYAVIVNDMSEINIDGSLIQPYIKHQEEEMVEMSNGCICCTLREDLLKEVVKIAKENKFDHLIIESTGISEPLPVAETFTFEVESDTDTVNEKLESLMNYAEIDSMVTVIDGVNFLMDIQNAEDLELRKLQANENDTRTITDLLVSQLEFASVVIINKCDLISLEKINKIKQWIRALNINAKILESSIHQKIDINEIIGSKSFNFEVASQSAAWLKAINNKEEKIPETEEYGISSFVYRSRRPFHPDRLMNFINSAFTTETHEDNEEMVMDPSTIEFDVGKSKILRSKGFFWLASDPTQMSIWSQAGGLFQFSYGGNWWVDTNKELWPGDEIDVKNIMNDFDGVNGDRRQELVFIGTDMDIPKIIKCLDTCLLNDDEMSLGEKSWVSFHNPFPIIIEEFDETV